MINLPNVGQLGCVSDLELITDQLYGVRITGYLYEYDDVHFVAFIGLGRKKPMALPRRTQAEIA